ncbi:MAG TPA: PE family protein, partial [Mycolicibacillus parakoreensis]|nr:PE family protein [Mycolicibacillus parakoreensis]
MSFVTTRPEALVAAAGNLAALGSALAAQNGAAAAPTTTVTPAAADPVSALQAAQFSTYGTLYQQISAQADAIHHAVVATLGSNAASYGGVETANAAEAGLLDGGGSSGLLGLFTGGGSYGAGAGMLSNAAMMGVGQISNFGSAASIFSAIPPAALTGETELGAGEALSADGGALAAAPAPAAGATAAPVSAATGQSASAGRLSVPASWGTTAPTAANPANALAGARAGAAPAEMPYAGVPGGLPAAAAGGDHHGPTGATKY